MALREELCRRPGVAHEFALFDVDTPSPNHFPDGLFTSYLSARRVQDHLRPNRGEDALVREAATLHDLVDSFFDQEELPFLQGRGRGWFVLFLSIVFCCIR